MANRSLIFILFIIIQLFSFKVQGQTIWFPDDLNVQPYTANALEPKAGFEFLNGRNEIRLNVGTSRDFYKSLDSNIVFSFGGDFFTYSLLRSERDFHFPVDAIDYLFGLNASYKIKIEEHEYGLRFRLSHISAHFVDGHYDYAENNWRNGQKPQVYSREFIELAPFYKFKNLRLYTILTAIFNITPDKIGKEIYQAGFDYYYPNWPFDIINPFLAYDFKLSKFEKFIGSNSLTLGFKFGKYDSKGFSIRFSYFSGRSIHGEYYSVYEKYTSIGFNIEL
ncbi:MAG: DUF1207 domain-containing protein [Ignavibacteriaceae bacterium]|nr:DUF1207 domain-containing protein [Ignavibacteriaceae bacterium]